MAVSSTFCVEVLPPVWSQPAATLFHSSVFAAWGTVSSHSLVTISLHHFDLRDLCCHRLVTDFSAWRMPAYLTSPPVETIAHPWSTLLISPAAFLVVIDQFLRADGQNGVQCRRQSTTQIYTVAQLYFQFGFFFLIISKFVLPSWMWIQVQK